MSVFYNDFHKPACAILREMMDFGLIGKGLVDGRDVTTIQPRELDGYDRVHLFAGIGGFELAAQAAGWPEGVRLWTGGFPCQPFSCAGSQKRTKDNRYLWPEFYRLIRGCRPEFVLIENVAAIDGVPDMVLDRVLVDLDAVGYETWCAEIPACAVDAAHQRNRVWIVAHYQGNEQREQAIRGPQAKYRDGSGSALANCPSERRGAWRTCADERRKPDAASGRSWGDLGWIGCHDFDALGRQRFRRIPLGLLDPSVVMADAVPSRTLALHGLGNAIVPTVAEEIMRAMLDVAQR